MSNNGPPSIQTIAARITFPFVVIGLMSYTLHSFIVRVYGRLLQQPDVRLLVIAVSLWCLSLLTYTRLWFTSPGYPTTTEPSCSFSSWSSSSTDGDIINDTTTRIPNTPRLSLCDADGQPRICSVCNVLKPARTHHCRQCNRCVLKMDHHCPWIGGCVGQNNHRLFYLFLLYTTTYACWMMSVVWSPLTHAISAGQPITLRSCWKVYKLYLYTLFRIGVNIYRIGRYRYWIPLLTGVADYWGEYASVDIHWVIMLLLGILFPAVLCGFTGFHSYCILRNRTTIEHASTRPYHIRVDYPNDEDNENVKGGGDVGSTTTTSTTTTTTSTVIQLKASERLWDDGIKNNWISVMGVSPWFWLVPLGQHYEKTRNEYCTSSISVNSSIMYNRIIQEAATMRSSSSSSTEQGVAGDKNNKKSPENDMVQKIE